jgi:2-polyprenyl-3-methyl-5-hydroxy-6-metoxy-1,4-benzoquinol methylase
MASADPEAQVKACYSTWAETYHTDYFGPQASYPPVHRDLVIRLVRESGARSLLDAGCGPATFLREFAGLGMDLYGFDLTPEMVVEAQRVMRERGVEANHIWQGSVTNPDSYRGAGDRTFDAAICLGVLPHVPADADAAVIANLRDRVRPGGLVVVEARNQLFALFTLNRYSYDLFVKELIGAPRSGSAPDGATMQDALAELQTRFRMDLPPIRKGKEGEPGYDEVLSRAHNPLLLARAFRDAGFTKVRTLFYHFHCLPPMLQSRFPEFFLKESLAREDPEDWRGYFMASAFLVAGERA